MRSSFKSRVNALVKKHGVTYKTQTMQGGWPRIAILCENDLEFNAVRDDARRIKTAYVDYWYCAAGGVFEAYVYIMKQADKDAMTEYNNIWAKHCENWWQANHEARLAGATPHEAMLIAEAAYPTPKY